MGKKEQNIALSLVILTSTLLLVWYWFWGRIHYQLSPGGSCATNLMFWAGFVSLVLLFPLVRWARSTIRPEVSEQGKKKALWLMGTFLLVLNGFGIWAVLFFVNGAFDKSLGTPHEVKVIGKKERPYGKNPSFNLYVESWKSPPETWRIKLTVEDYDRLNVKKSDTVIVEVGKGALGCEWIKGVSIKSSGVGPK